MNSISGSVGAAAQSFRQGVIRNEEESPQKSSAEKMRELLEPKDVAEISDRARELAAEAKEARENESAAKEGRNPEDGWSWSIVEAIKDPDDPENKAKATMRMIASGEGRTPGVNAR